MPMQSNHSDPNRVREFDLRRVSMMHDALNDKTFA